MSLFEGSAPPNIETTKTATATAPQYLTDYLTKLATEGTGQLGLTGAQLVAPQSQLTKDVYAAAPSALTRYQTPMDQALTAGQAGATGVTAQDISAFYDPYRESVVDEAARQSALNVQRNVLPMLRGAFAGSGGFGSRRYAGATGQALADIEANLLGEQNKLRSAGFTSALDAALKQKGYQTQASQALSQLGSAEQQAAATGLKTGAELGQQQQAYDQAQIEAPLTRALNVAQLLRGYTYPTATTEKYIGPANVYGPSPLSQIAGLGSLLGSAFNPTVNPKTGEIVSQGFGNVVLEKAGDFFGDVFGGIKDIFGGGGG
jgi:hypothetical protein